MKEIWKPVPGFEGRYAVSNLGRVKSLAFKQRYLLRNGEEAWRITQARELSQQTTNAGYRIVHLYADGARQAKTVHRLVLAAFMGDSPLEVNHKDGNKTNNCLGNLEYTDSSSNKAHAVLAGLNAQAIVVIGRSKAGGEESVYPSCAEAAFALTGNRANGTKISACLAGKRASAFGCTWRRA